jgi:hypothetical protein
MKLFGAAMLRNEADVVESFVRHNLSLLDCAARRSNADLAFHWRELYRELADGQTLSVERLRAVAANYGLPMTAWLPPEQIALVEDPLPVGEVRYGAMIRDATLPLVLRFAERLAMR